MGQFDKLDDADLRKALSETAEAIQHGYSFLRNLSDRQSLGLTLMAESMPGLLDKLEVEKRELEAEYDRRHVKGN